MKAKYQAMYSTFFIRKENVHAPTATSGVLNVISLFPGMLFFVV